MHHDDAEPVFDASSEAATFEPQQRADFAELGVGVAVGQQPTRKGRRGAPAGGSLWAPPVQEHALDPELVAILWGGSTDERDALDGAAPVPGRGAADDRSDPEADSGSSPEGAGEDLAADDASEDDVPDQEALVRAVAALLFASPEALSSSRLAELLGGVSKRAASLALELLGSRLAAAGLPWVVRQIAGGWRLFTDPELADVVARLDTSRKTERISPAALETLSIIAYRQPVTKAEIEAIRGVQAGPILRTLVDRRLIRVTGRADQPGSPLLYGTTQEFLDRFGLASIGDLPRDGELARD